MPALLLRAASFGAQGVVWAALVASGWLVAASLVFMAFDDLLTDATIPAHQRPVLWLLAARAGIEGRLTVEELLYLAAGAGIPTAMLATAGRLWIVRNGGWRGVAQTALGMYLVVRSSSHTHGKADWMPMEDVRKLFPDEPDHDIGGVVLGEAVRLDTTAVAGVRFDPDDKETWGPAGTGPLMFDRCRIGSTHGLVMVNSGGYKTTSLMMTLDYWKTGCFVFDPSEEIAAMTRQWRERLGHKVHVLDPEGNIGTNVVKWVSKCVEHGHPLADVYLTVTVERCYGKTPPQPGQTTDNAAYFRDQGRNLFTAILAHVLWDTTLPADQKTLRQAKKLLALPEDDLRCVLRNIYETSESDLARHLVGPMFDLPKITFGGISSNAAQATNWLGVKSFADMVSRDDFDLAELCDGRTTVYCQIGMDALEAMPEVGRAIGSAAFNSVMQAKGKVRGRVWFWIEEADLYGPMGVFETVRDRGRKYRITMCLSYTSEGLMRAVWDKRASAWFSGVAWVMYGVQADNDTAKALSGRLGTFGAKEYGESTNKGTSGKMMELGTRNHGSSSSTRDTKRDLMMPHELMQDMRTDERILLVLGEKPIRCTAAIAWRRPEVVNRIGKTDYQPASLR